MSTSPSHWTVDNPFSFNNDNAAATDATVNPSIEFPITNLIKTCLKYYEKIY